MSGDLEVAVASVIKDRVVTRFEAKLLFGEAGTALDFRERDIFERAHRTPGLRFESSEARQWWDWTREKPDPNGYVRRSFLLNSGAGMLLGGTGGALVYLLTDLGAAAFGGGVALLGFHPVSARALSRSIPQVELIKDVVLGALFSGAFWGILGARLEESLI